MHGQNPTLLFGESVQTKYFYGRDYLVKLLNVQSQKESIFYWSNKRDKRKIFSCDNAKF